MENNKLQILLDRWQMYVDQKKEFEERSKKNNNEKAATMWRHKREGIELCIMQLKSFIKRDEPKNEYPAVLLDMGNHLTLMEDVIKELLPLAEDGYTLHVNNACHQEFLTEDREIIAKARIVINDRDEKDKIVTELKANNDNI